MKVLFVVNSNYPYESTGTNLLNKLLYEGGLLDKLETVDVLGGKESYFDKDFEKSGKINVYKAWAWTTLPKEEIKKVFIRNPLGAIGGCFIKIYGKALSISSRQRFADLLTYKAFYKMLKKIHADKYDIIVAISGRYYQSIAASRYCKEKKINFILYQVDPCRTNQSMPEKTLHIRRKIEKQLYENAKLVITTPIIFKEWKQNKDENDKSAVVSMEFPLITKLKEEPGKRKKMTDKRVCMFVGSIYGGIRDPEYTIRLFEKLGKQENVELQFIGVKTEDLPVKLRLLGVKCQGKIPVEEAFAKMQQADFLVNIGNSVENQVPSKIFDYISTGKPIINICKSRKCPSLVYLERYPLCLNLYEEASIFEKQVVILKEFINSQKVEKLDFEYIEKLYKECTPIYCANFIYEKFKEMMREK